MGAVKSGEGAAAVSAQLETAINSESAQGWEFYQLAEVNIEVSPGCLAGLFGAKAEYTKFDQIVFRRPK